MSQWTFVIAAYGVAMLGTIAITLWSFTAMRRAERDAAVLRRER